MFKFKFVLPMLAFVLAIGMSFAFTTNNSVAADEVVIINGTAFEVNANCNGEAFNCRVQLTDESGDPIPGEIYQVYGPDSSGDYTVLLKSESEEPIKVSATSLMPIE